MGINFKLSKKFRKICRVEFQKRLARMKDPEPRYFSIISRYRGAALWEHVKNVLNALKTTVLRRFEYHAPDESPADSLKILTNYQVERKRD